MGASGDLGSGSGRADLRRRTGDLDLRASRVAVTAICVFVFIAASVRRTAPAGWGPAAECG